MMVKIEFNALSNLSGLIMEDDLLLHNCSIINLLEDDESGKELVKWNLSNIHYSYSDVDWNEEMLKHFGNNYFVKYKCELDVEDYDNFKFFEFDFEECKKTLNILINCFRLFKKGLIGTNYVIFKPTKKYINNKKLDVIQVGRKISLDTKRYIAKKNILGAYFIYDFEKKEFINFYSNYYNKIYNISSNIKRSIDWFNKIYLDVNCEDILLNLVISLETLYQIRGLRLILRCTYNLGKNNDEREMIYNNLDEALDLRNNIVHGGTINQEKCERILKIIEEYARQSIIKFLDERDYKGSIKTLDRKIKRGT